MGHKKVNRSSHLMAGIFFLVGVWACAELVRLLVECWRVCGQL